MVLSTSSYVIPGTYLENVRFLDSIRDVRGIELLFFLYNEETEELFRQERSEIESFAGRFRFSVHMPDPLRHVHERLIDATGNLAESYVVHVPDSAGEEFVALVGQWRDRYGDIFYLENLIDREFDHYAKRLDGIPLCCDIGHLLMRGEDPSAFLSMYNRRIREVHLHGIRDGSDHAGFSGDAQWLPAILPFLRSFTGRLNLEVFSFEEVAGIITVLKQYGIVEEGV